MNNQRRDALAKIQPLFNAVISNLERIKAELEDVKADEEEAFSNAPQGKQDGDWGQESQAVTSAIETLIDAIDSLDLSDEMDELSRAIDRDLEAPKGRISKDVAEQRRFARLPEWAKERLFRAEQARDQAIEESKAKYEDWKEGSKYPAFSRYDEALAGKQLPTREVDFPQCGILVKYNPHYNGIELYAYEEALIARGSSSNVMYIKTERL